MVEGEGARAERARHRRKWMFAGGLIVVTAAAMTLLQSFARPEGSGVPIYPPAVALLAAVLFPILFVWALRIGFRMEDERGTRFALEAYAVGFITLIAADASWLMLSLGGFTGKPKVELLILISSAAAVVTLLWRKLRG